MHEGNRGRCALFSQIIVSPIDTLQKASYRLAMARSTALPMSAGLAATSIPAASRAATFSAAVPLPPEMIAPAMLYMCSELSGDQTNKILGVSGQGGVRELKIFQAEGWRPTGPWQAQDMVKHADKIFFKDDAKVV